METVDIDSMQTTNQSENDLRLQLEDILSNIISTLDIYDVVESNGTYSVINLKNDNILYEDIQLKVVADVITAALNTGEDVFDHAISKLLEVEKVAVSKMMEVHIYESLVGTTSDMDRLPVYESKLTEAEIRSKRAVSDLVRTAENILPV